MSNTSVMDGTQPRLTAADLAMNRGPTVVILSASTWAIACVAIILRFLSRRISRAPLMLDDWLILPSQLLALGGVLLTVFATAHGFGRHIEVAERDAGIYIWRCVFATNIIYTVTIFFVKSSLLAFYWRLFKLTFLKWPIIITQGINIAWLVSSIFLRIFQCSPVQKFWITDIPGKCFEPEKLWLGSSVANIATDFFMLIMPLPCVWSMNITRAQRILSSGIFLLGGCVSVISIIRFLSIYYLVPDADITWNFVGVATWTTMEMNLAIVSACLPCLRPVINIVCKGRSLSAPSDPRRIDPARNTWHRLGANTISHGRHGFVKLDDESTMQDFDSDKHWRPSIFEMKAPSAAKKYEPRASTSTIPSGHMGWD